MTVSHNGEFSHDDVLKWVTSQRWFGDKARPVTGYDVDEEVLVDVGGETVALRIITVNFEWGSSVSYLLPTIERDRTHADAFRSPRFLEWFMAGFAEERVIDDGSVWTWRRTSDVFPSLAGLDYDAAKPISGEQSNTSIVFDHRFIGKMFRRLQSGVNPDLEIGEFLTDAGRFSHTPALFGTVEVNIEGDVFAIAAIQEFVPNQGDGWTWLLNRLRAGGIDQVDRVLLDVEMLARRTAELHIALASDDASKEFSPEVFSASDAEGLKQRVIAEINDSVEGLIQILEPAEVERLHRGLGEIMGDAYALEGTYKIRVHGDYHLGQTLRTANDDFCLIDFEGEPSRSMEQRRMKLPALKDVAGMVRSLDYAAATIANDVESDEDRDAVMDWSRRAGETFVSAYLAQVNVAQLPLVPQDASKLDDAMALMLAEKALYEVRYELNNRPDWVWIPLNALKSLTGMTPDNARR